MSARHFDEAQERWIPGVGFRFGDMFKHISGTLFTGDTYNVPSTFTHILLMAMNCAAFAVLTWYLDNIIPGEYGTAAPLYFPFTSTYWGVSLPWSKRQQDTNYESIVDIPADADADVVAEALQVASQANTNTTTTTSSSSEEGQVSSGLRVVDLCMTFWQRRRLLFWRRKEGVQAVKNLYFQISPGQIFALLGHNGAGKSTTLGILTGVLQATAGDAFLDGLSISKDMDRIKRLIGVCPQHDLLWSLLTAGEHIELFARLKGVEPQDISNTITHHLEEVDMLKFRDQPAGKFSGGMRRRLTIALAAIGQPRIVYLDEPTTGLDPLSRSYVWTLVRRLKRGRMVLLTTHSMEEAEALGDRIGIMAQGTLQCIGNSLHLKTRFGSGYHVSIVTAASRENEARRLVQEYAPGAECRSHNAGSLVFQVMDPKHVESLVRRLEQFANEDEELRLVREFSLSHTTLEDVFHTVTKTIK
mmetsp:Transcript_40061/g.64977  ORF Transcript_40061/g.64977 Transcript_40061/m.64977 type:complete len:472 (+) Transcript_40061:135-1550(+)